MKVGNLVKVKNPSQLTAGDDEAKARKLYPWKFEVGIVTNTEPWGSFPGKEVYVHFPSHPEKTILCKALEIIQ